MEDKMSTNAVSVRDDADDAATAADEAVSSGLFVNFSRVNHSCVPNANHWYHPAQKLMLLVANHAIAEGDEVTFSYAANVSAKNYDGGRRAVLKKGWGIDPCDCRACRPPAAPEHGGDADLDAKVDMRVDLDGRLNDFQMGVLGDMEREGGTWGAKVASADRVVDVQRQVIKFTHLPARLRCQRLRLRLRLRLRGHSPESLKEGSKIEKKRALKEISLGRAQF